MPLEPGETYLGDAVYASHDGFQIKLRTGDGRNQVVYLDPDVYRALVRYETAIRVEAMARQKAAGKE